MRHDIAYFRKIQGAYESESLRQTQLRQAAGYVKKNFYKTIDWEKVLVNGEDAEYIITPGSNFQNKLIRSKP